MKYASALFLIASIGNFIIYGMSSKNSELKEFVSAYLHYENFEKAERSVAVFEIYNFVDSCSLDSQIILTVYTHMLLEAVRAIHAKENAHLLRWCASMVIPPVKDEAKRVGQICGKTKQQICQEIGNFDLKTMRLQPEKKRESCVLKRIILPSDIALKIPTLETIEVMGINMQQMDDMSIEMCGKLYPGMNVGYWIASRVENGKEEQKAVFKMDRIIKKPGLYDFSRIVYTKKLKITISQQEFSLVEAMVALRGSKIFALS